MFHVVGVSWPSEIGTLTLGMADDPPKTGDPQESEPKSMTPQERSRANLIPFQVGHKGIAGPGRPKSLATRIAALTNNGEELIQIWLDIARNGRADRDRIAATNHLIERLAGKAVETSVLLKGDLADAGELLLTSDALEALARTIRDRALPAPARSQIVEGSLVSAVPSAAPKTLEPANPPTSDPTGNKAT